MKVNPISPTAPAVNPPRRAVLVVRHDRFAVYDRETRQETPLPENEAWDRYHLLNMEV